MSEAQLPETMRCVAIREPGPPGVLTLETRPLPRPGAGELLIRVAAAGVNRPDCLQRRGLYPPPPGASDLPGLEVAGTVAALGPGVADWSPGAPVCALLAGGGYAEYCTAPAAQCLPIPAGLSLAEAAALPEAAFTVWTNLFERGRLAAGETVLVHGGASGIGTTAIQMARAAGARVYATAGSAAKCALCERLGAEQAVNHREAEFAGVVAAATGGRGVDVILDIVGAAYLEANLRTLAPDGRLVVIGVLGGARGELDLGRMLTRRLTVTASTLRAREPAAKGAIAAALHGQVWPWIEAGGVRPVIQARFPLADAARAHALLEANEAQGKLVLDVAEAP